MADCISKQINYIEWPAKDLSATKTFFQEVFDWHFTDYGDQYTAFSGDTVNGGFFHADKTSRPEQGAALVVLYSSQLEVTQHEVERGGGQITQPIFEFPGGRRFHFTEPSGNELAVWSDK
ncbi:hypothetical protein HMF8227_01778 [Saliniradius amylolyticus]|uniref:VOC domain-containing protein n=1 Tax=Saliniradius amylolyticus TaxID=2183582 RepID=A0A2S2E3M7_9ALTE|nr:VOC family protein [Saliniradius amylolyticus]AWL12251.1 hypothetical protein HMF8227_01778 [Saliniradius amylolyticus]